MYGMFEIDGKVYSADHPLNCGLSEKTQVEWKEPVTAYADSNLEDTWYALER